mmetsp:Transcript_87211/g.191654  ORF Transcript_87211/g.191654 Transcript_87211/m.191654 type:complete len:90 (-) Transcript_87211:74-343(-)
MAMRVGGAARVALTARRGVAFSGLSHDEVRGAMQRVLLVCQEVPSGTLAQSRSAACHDETITAEWKWVWVRAPAKCWLVERSVATVETN